MTSIPKLSVYKRKSDVYKRQELHSDLFIQKERFKTKYDKHAEEVYILTENESGATRLACLLYTSPLYHADEFQNG